MAKNYLSCEAVILIDYGRRQQATRQTSSSDRQRNLSMWISCVFR